MVCAVEGCASPVRCRGWCNAHYKRWRRNGHPTAPVSRKGLGPKPGPQHPNWKGGRTRDPSGYVLRLVPEDHPLASMRNAAGYVREHRLVMAEHLGRPLHRDESVHHINGDRADNRLENLELWVSHQPAGQRPEDLVAWAREILRRYADGN